MTTLIVNPCQSLHEYERIPASRLPFTQPNLPLLIQEIEALIAGS
ncbi:MAG TPA: hypothetical protein PKE45_19275 [Caldilineaceae bacterium]|nr:hypothetical protein [Caldilineaceae bacterium]